jgi:ADP-ribosylglycohydrolase
VPRASGQAREDQFLGALLGMAIGDALGRVMSELPPSSRDSVLAGSLSYDVADGADPVGGEISDRTEIALCLIESLTTNEGRPDPENMAARMAFLAAGPSRTHMSSAMVNGIEQAVERDGQVDPDYQPLAELSVATRGIPVGLLHAVGGFDRSSMERDAVVVTRLSHAGEAQESLTTLVAESIAAAGRSAAIGDEGHRPDVPAIAGLRESLDIGREADTFESGLRQALVLEGDLLSLGAITGGLLGVRLGASGIPQDLIDGLDARIYLSLAAPWFYRTAVMRGGTVIDLREIR